MPAAGEEDAGPSGHLRVDKWLWFARVVKSRTLAASLVEEGKVRVNRAKATKASQLVRVDDVITISVGPRVRILRIAALGTRRGPAPEAQRLYVDLTPPPPDPAAPAAAGRDPGTGRPTKRDRRLIARLKDEP